MIFWAGKFTCHMTYHPYSQFWQVIGHSEDERHFTRYFDWSLKEDWTDEKVMRHICITYGACP